MQGQSVLPPETKVMMSMVKPERPVGAPYSRNIQIGAIALVATALFFIAQVIAQMGWPDYSVWQSDVSALGVTTCGQFNNLTGGQFYACSPYHAVMNTGFVLMGLLVFVGMILTRPVWPRRRVSTVGMSLVAISGIGSVIAGLAPADVNLPLHVIGALTALFSGALGITLLGFAIRRYSVGLVVWSWLCSGTILLGSTLLGQQMFFGIGPGGMQRVQFFPITIWTIGVGLTLIYRQYKLGTVEGALHHD